jgi:hypothetical protein
MREREQQVETLEKHHACCVIGITEHPLCQRKVSLGRHEVSDTYRLWERHLNCPSKTI